MLYEDDHLTKEERETVQMIWAEKRFEYQKPVYRPDEMDRLRKLWNEKVEGR
ncbi:hypothetical protein [Paenibacillus sp. HJGM_3]|uniref:hypothetical protein n=1 Tax=Paenibacillus sp. HJGM_3 TaxID=3379816 RepID=UPI00385EF6D6